MSEVARFGRATPRGLPRSGGWVAALGLSLLGIAGCPQPAANDPATPFLDQDGNFDFDRATALAIDDDAFAFSGTISGDNDIDVFKLVTLQPGDRLIVDVERTSGNLDPVAAVFDSTQRLIAYNDDRTPDGSNRNPRIDFILPGDAARELFLGIVTYPDSGSTGNYVVDLTIERNVGKPVVDGQIVYLDFRGGSNIDIPNVGVFNLPSFNAADLGTPFTGQSGAIKAIIEAEVRERYQGYNLTLLNSDTAAKPSGPHSTVYFGSINERAFAIAEQIDTLNQDESDDAIVFTQSFNDSFSVIPSTQEMGIALGNTAAHEIGHLLGLVHTEDCAELMDATCGNDRILSKQFFGNSQLDDFVFPIGTQDAALLLEWVLGIAGL
ncbi:MAG: matrixin family metalloprotease [Phycisphaerae bacterium]|nr:matrixin family metalloprotease [Phycisphaerae bacterium]